MLVVGLGGEGEAGEGGGGVRQLQVRGIAHLDDALAGATAFEPEGTQPLLLGHDHRTEGRLLVVKDAGLRRRGGREGDQSGQQ